MESSEFPETPQAETPQDVVNFEHLLSPIAMAANFWGDGSLYGWQAGAMMDTFEVGSMIGLVSPNEAGKTAVLVADLGLSFMALNPGCQVVSTAGVYRQIEQQLWPVLRSKLSPYPEWKIVEGKITAPRVLNREPSTWTAFAASDAQKAEGYHGQMRQGRDGLQYFSPLLIIIDEAKGVAKDIFEAVDRCAPQHYLVVSTPGEDTGEFHRIITTKPPGWKIYDIGWADCPHLMRGHAKVHRQRKIAELGNNHPFVQSMVHGNFIRHGAYFVFDEFGFVDRAMSGTLPVYRSDRAAAVDVSGGGDEQVFMCRDGNDVHTIEGFREKNSTKQVDRLDSLFRKYNLQGDWITIDNGGLGKVIIDMLIERGWSGIRRYNFNAKPRDPTCYFNRAAEDHFRLRLMMAEGQLRIKNDPALREQMRSRKFEMPHGDDNRMRMESKDAIRSSGRPSPDRLDDLVMLTSNMPDIDYMKNNYGNVHRLRTESNAGPIPVRCGTAGGMNGMNCER